MFIEYSGQYLGCGPVDSRRPTLRLTLHFLVLLVQQFNVYYLVSSLSDGEYNDLWIRFLVRIPDELRVGIRLSKSDHAILMQSCLLLLVLQLTQFGQLAARTTCVVEPNRIQAHESKLPSRN